MINISDIMKSSLATLSSVHIFLHDTINVKEVLVISMDCHKMWMMPLTKSVLAKIIEIIMNHLRLLPRQHNWPAWHWFPTYNRDVLSYYYLGLNKHYWPHWLASSGVLWSVTLVANLALSHCFKGSYVWFQAYAISSHIKLWVYTWGVPSL